MSADTGSIQIGGEQLEAVRRALRLALRYSAQVSAAERETILVAFVCVGSAEEAQLANTALYHHRESEAAQMRLNIAQSPHAETQA